MVYSFLLLSFTLCRIPGSFRRFECRIFGVEGVHRIFAFALFIILERNLGAFNMDIDIQQAHTHRDTHLYIMYHIRRKHLTCIAGGHLTCIYEG
ncbi:hypothetical protein B0T17DRAFT_360066 [Bombardia bombarda]|uniref:Uncharacterized protein n=1 Tax=Bombardia bombarda TaxID=252184 RepID=A0AA39WIA6_9PEZI|nr:hypothetical protein B0T17DRAFT_360066 [Bombardia bombarda]